MANNELFQYIDNELKEGSSELQIRERLAKDGNWDEKNISSAFRKVYYQESLMISIWLFILSPIIGFFALGRYIDTLGFIFPLILPVLIVLHIFTGVLMNKLFLRNGSFLKKIFAWLFLLIITAISFVMTALPLILMYLAAIILSLYLSYKTIKSSRKAGSRYWSWFNLIYIVMIVFPLLYIGVLQPVTNDLYSNWFVPFVYNHSL